MAWTPADLKEALAKLDPKLTITEKADILNARTMVLRDQPFLWSEAMAIARGATTLDWARIVARSRMTPTLPPPGTPLELADLAILIAIDAMQSKDGDIIDPVGERGWARFSQGLQVLQAVGDLSDDTVSKIQALTTKTVPVWASPVSTGDIQTAEGQP